MELRHVDFGRYDAVADKERLASGDVFHTNTSWEQAYGANCVALFGSKGSGKTAIRLRLEAKGLHSPIQTKHLAMTLSLRGFPAEILNNLLSPCEKLPLFDKKTFFKKLWRYIFIAAAGYAVVRSQNREVGSLLPRTRALLENPDPDFPHTQDNTLSFNFREIFLSAAGMVPQYFARKDIAEVAKVDFPVGQPRFAEAEAELNKVLKDKKLNVVLCIDNFDDDYGSFRDIVEPMVTGFLYAAMVYYEDYPNSPIAVRAFLPRDTISPNQFRDVDKVPHSVIYWTKDDLAMFIAKRIFVCARSIPGCPREVRNIADAYKIISYVLPKSLSGKTPYTAPFDWIYYSTLSRPRDLQIVFTELQAARLAINPRAEAIEEDDLWKNLPSICTGLAEKSLVEYKDRYPEVRSLLDHFWGSAVVLSRDEISTFVQRARSLTIKDVDYWVQALYECGFLGVPTNSRMPGDNLPTYIFAFQKHGDDRFRGATSFAIHRMFWERFNITVPDGFRFRYPEEQGIFAG